MAPTASALRCPWPGQAAFASAGSLAVPGGTARRRIPLERRFFVKGVILSVCVWRFRKRTAGDNCKCTFVPLSAGRHVPPFSFCSLSAFALVWAALVAASPAEALVWPQFSESLRAIEIDFYGTLGRGSPFLPRSAPASARARTSLRSGVLTVGLRRPTRRLSKLPGFSANEPAGRNRNPLLYHQFFPCSPRVDKSICRYYGLSS